VQAAAPSYDRVEEREFRTFRLARLPFITKIETARSPAGPTSLYFALLLRCKLGNDGQ